MAAVIALAELRGSRESIRTREHDALCAGSLTGDLERGLLLAERLTPVW
jgi:hypothetical protein